MQPSFLKKNAQYIWIILGFLAISYLYCLPQLQGQKLSVHDALSWEAASHEARAYEDSTGITPLWTNNMFGGMPTYIVYLNNTKNWVFNIQKAVEAVVPVPAFLFFYAMLGFFVLACSLRVNKWIGVLGAIAYAFATYNPVIISAGHITKMYAIAGMPGALAGFLMIYNGRRLSGAAIMGLFLTLMITMSHYQIIYYTGIIFVIAGIGIAINELKNGRAKNLIIGSIIALGVGLLSIAPSLPSVMTTAEYTKYTMRGGASELKTLKKNVEDKSNGGLDKNYAFAWSNGIGETFCLLIPQLYGGASGQPVGENSKFYETLTSLGVSASQAESMADQAPTYWGPQPGLSGPVYFGAIVCFLFILGMLLLRSNAKWWILAASILAIMMSWGNHFEGFNYFLFDHLPMYNKFRAPSMVLVIPQLLFPLLGVLVLNDIFNNKIDKELLLKKLKMATAITAGLCIVLAVGGQAFFDFKSANDAAMAQQYSQSANNPEIGKKIVNAIVEDRASIAMNSGLMSAFFILAAAALIWAFSKNKLKKEMAIAGLALLMAVDLIPTAKLYLNKNKFQDEIEYEKNFQPRQVDIEILKDKDPYYRVFDITKDPYSNAMQSYFHKTVGGYSAAKMESFQDLIDVHLSNSINSEVLNMLNTKYIIFNGGQGGQPAFQLNMAACGNGWFVSQVKFVNTADDEMTAMNASALGDTTQVPNAWKASETAIVRNTFATELGNKSNYLKDSTAAIRLTKYGLNELSFASANSNEGFAVFSDIYYDKGWKAYVDGKETPIVKVDYVLRGLKLPAGKHDIVFKFHPETFYKSNTYAMMSSILLYLLFGAALFMAFKNKDKESTTETV